MFARRFSRASSDQRVRRRVPLGQARGLRLGASLAVIAVIEPQDSTQDDRWDGSTSTGLVVTSRVNITLYARAEDPQIRDEGAELLLDITANALNGQSLAGLTLPDLTRVNSWRWSQPMPPERMIAVSFSYQYIVEGWEGYDTTP